MKRTMKHIILLILLLCLAFLAYVLIGAIAPFTTQPQVSAATREAFSAGDYYGTGEGPDRARVVDDNQEALELRLQMIMHARKRVILSTFDFRHDEAGLDMLAAAGTELADVKERLTRVMDNLSVTLESVNAVLKDNKGNIDGTLTHLNSISGNMDAVLAAEKGSLRTAIDNIGKFSTALGENSERFSSMIANLDRFSQQLTEADIDSLSLGLRTTLGELNRTVARINEGKGTVGRLMNDPRLYESLETASANLAALLEDLKAHPKRYVHFSLFGRKDKGEKVKTKEAAISAGDSLPAAR